MDGGRRDLHVRDADRLVDGDVVEGHNLNRQMFGVPDIGQFKARSLARRLRRINPDAGIRAYNIMIDADNAPSLVSEYDLVIDTVDFRDPAAIRALHASLASISPRYERIGPHIEERLNQLRGGGRASTTQPSADTSRKLPR